MPANVFTGQTYEDFLSQDFSVAMSEGSDFFAGHAKVNEALAKIVAKLDSLGVVYAVVGGMALVRYGYRRFTEDVDILVSREGLDKIHKELEGLGYLPPFAGSKHLRDCDLGVKIEFLTTGDYPGDGKPKAIAFPDPAAVAEDYRGIKFLRLTTLVELKLASGLTNPNRLKDLADVQELIKLKSLLREFGDQLHPFVQAKYYELWSAGQEQSSSAAE